MSSKLNPPTHTQENFRFDTVIAHAKDILEDDLSYAADTPLPYLDRHRQEQAVLECIRLGDEIRLNDLLNSPVERHPAPHIGTLSSDRCKQLQYLGIVAVTLASRSAISGGVPENAALALSDSYIQQVEQIYHPEQLKAFYNDVFRKFCSMVHSHSIHALSLPIQQCYDYMMVHLYSSVTLEELSRQCHLSPNYITDLFRKEFGMGAIRYFHVLKLKLAAYFLLHTELTVSEISTRLSYCSQSKFTQQFKSVYGQTPAHYRTAQKQQHMP